MPEFTDLPVPACVLRAGDTILLAPPGGTVRTVKAVVHGDRSLVTVDGWSEYVTLNFARHADIPLRSPSRPTDGWTTWRDPTGAQGILGCSCVYRRGATEADMWERAADDPQCRFHYPDEED